MDWDWMSRYRGSGAAEPADPADETVINGAPYDARKENRSSQNPAAPGNRSAAVAEEIKRQQLSAVVRYVAAIRAR